MISKSDKHEEDIRLVNHTPHKEIQVIINCFAYPSPSFVHLFQFIWNVF